MKTKLISLFLLFILFQFKLSASDYSNYKDFENDKSTYKLLVFLSEKCPCSRSHISHVQDLMDSYKDLKVYGVISEPAKNTNEQERKDEYFLKTKFGFPIINDPDQFLVKKYNALKTPHVVLFQLQKKGEFLKVYEGGITDSRIFSDKSKKYVKNSLDELVQGQKPKVKEGFCLGCYIRRF